ncbi:MAG: hypothetical protein WAO71_15630 [Gallionella sp.]
MAITELFSKRQKKLLGGAPDVYIYDEIPAPLRVQVVYIFNDSLYDRDTGYIVDTLCREYGIFDLPPGAKPIRGNRNTDHELQNFVLNEKSTDRILDAIELSFRRLNERYRHDNPSYADNLIDELNDRFKEHGVGYQFVNNEIIRIDSELIHTEVVKPALKLLNQKMYAGAQQEFLKAHEHYRHGNTHAALNDCLKAFESTMKSICDKRGWTYNQGATAKNLIEICFKNQLIPSFWESQFTSLRGLLESSIPTGRNKLSGHGQGSEIKEIPDYLVAYMLHMTASTLVFLGEA